MDIGFADIADLKKADEGSWYFIAGTGGDLNEWVKGYEDLMIAADIGKPTAWFQTNGATINAYARGRKGFNLLEDDLFAGNLICLLFPLTGLELSRLALFKLKMQDRWFNDVIDNMREI